MAGFYNEHEGGNLTVLQDDVIVSEGVGAINFTGDGVVVTDDGNGEVTVDITGGGGSGTYTPDGPTTFAVGGLPLGTDLGTTPILIQTLFDMILYAYVAAAITLATSPTTILREFGDTIASVILNATTVKHSDPIVAVTFFRDAVLIDTVPSPNPSGGLETYTDTTPVTTNTSYTAKVYDGTTTVISNTKTFAFIAAYYYGVAAPALDISVDGGGLTKVVQGNTISYATTTSPTSQVYYFAYPDSYPALTSILDNNGFETISDYTVTTGVSVTNSFASVDTYRVYEFNNLTTQVAFTNTYIQ